MAIRCAPHLLVSRRLRIMVSISCVIFILASLDGRLDLSDNSDLPCSFSRFIQRYNVERAIPHRRAVFVTEPVSAYSSSHFWRIRIFRIFSFMLRRYRLRFAYEKKKCSVSIDTLHIKVASGTLFVRERIEHGLLVVSRRNELPFRAALRFLLSLLLGKVFFNVRCIFVHLLFFFLPCLAKIDTLRLQ